jgi:1-acyl-sn-glycerol-3-phosphate acyltransferase
LILKAKHHFIIYPFFIYYALWIVRRHFNPVKIIGHFEEKGLPVLLISNHMSWWDGFWAMYLRCKVFKRRYHFMMLEEQLRKYWFFNYTGGFSVRKGAKSVVETINYTAGLLSDSRNMVLVFPQGEIQSMHRQQFEFEKGIEKILQKAKGKVQVVFLANLVDYFSSPRPGIYFYLSEFSGDSSTIEHIEKSYNGFYRQSIEQHIKNQK